MYNDISMLGNGRGRIFLDMHRNVISVLMGASIPGYSFEDMADIWTISGTYISTMYKARLKSIKSRKGIGKKTINVCLSLKR